jgi:alkylated DNA repair dioxygenase AlkB
MAKRTLDAFFSRTTVPLPASKKQHVENETSVASNTLNGLRSSHNTYPWSIPHLPESTASEIEQLVTTQGRAITDQPQLDLLYFQPFIPRHVARELFNFLRSELFFYRVQYTIKRFGVDTVINTPRYTTVFGVDETSRFELSSLEEQGLQLVDVTSKSPVRKTKYKCSPRPIPECLDLLRRVTEAATNTSYNFCLVNYYGSGNDSISYHSDDETFLGKNPAIASFTLGATRDFLMKRKPPRDQHQVGDQEKKDGSLKLPLIGGDMVLMRGPTQSNWLHSIPKRKNVEADKGRINITFRKAMIPAGTENYYHYNVGNGQVFRWDVSKKEMVTWSK